MNKRQQADLRDEALHAVLKYSEQEGWKGVLKLLEVLNAGSYWDIVTNFEKYRATLEALTGPHGATVYKMLLARTRHNVD